MIYAIIILLCSICWSDLNGRVSLIEIVGNDLFSLLALSPLYLYIQCHDSHAEILNIKKEILLAVKI